MKFKWNEPTVIGNQFTCIHTYTVEGMDDPLGYDPNNDEPIIFIVVEIISAIPQPWDKELPPFALHIRWSKNDGFIHKHKTTIEHNIPHEDCLKLAEELYA